MGNHDIYATDMHSKMKKSEEQFEVDKKGLKGQIKQQYQGMTRIAHRIFYSD